MKKAIIFVSLLALTRSYAQDHVRNYVQQNTAPVYSIDPDSINYKDLQALGNAIGDAKVVMLGEQDHGDAPAFLAKTRIIKYLHEEKGFNVLAFESDFFGLNYGWDVIKKDEKSIDSLLKTDIFPVWSYCNACRQLLYSYVPSTVTHGRPLEITGFDNQISRSSLPGKLDSLVRSCKIPITRSPQYTAEVLPLLQDWGRNVNDTVLSNKCVAYLTVIREELQKKLAKDDFWLQVLDNLITENIQNVAGKTDYWKKMNTRDQQMAFNLRWLAEIKYPKEKIIVWAHNYHVSKYGGHYPQEFMNKANSMGTVFTNNAGMMDKTYILGFTSYEGTAGRIYSAHYKVDAPKKNSFENWVPHTLDYGFVDFKKFNQANPSGDGNFYMSGAVQGNWYHKNTEAQWNNIFDGVFFIRKMVPCEKIE
jgi:erythromycin esterase